MNYPKHIVAVGALVKNNHDKFLLVKTERRGWELPGGQVEEGEDILTALKREVEEESGTHVVVQKLAAIYSSVSEPSKVIFDFNATHNGGNGEIKTTEEIVDVNWFSKEEIESKVQSEIMRYRIQWLLENHDEIRYASYAKNPFTILSEILFKEKSAT
jgi:8-oxo-dGTP diphosphatase